MCKYKIFNKKRIEGIVFQSNLKDEIISNKNKAIEVLKDKVKQANDEISNLKHKLKVVEHAYDEQEKLLKIKCNELDNVKEVLDTTRELLSDAMSDYYTACNANDELKDKLAKFYRPRDSKGHFIKTKKK